MRLLLALLAISMGHVHREAEQYYEAGQYDEAIKRFEVVLEEGGSQSRIVYNLGNAYLGNCQWEEALDLYLKVAQDGDFSPQLLGRLHLNRALALVEGGRQVGSDDDELSFQASVRRALSLYNQAAKACQESVEAEKQWALVNGGELDCCPEELVALRQIIKVDVAALLERQRSFYLAHMTLNEGLGFLSKRIDQSLRHLEGSSCAQVAKIQRQLDPYWDALVCAAHRHAEQVIDEAGPFESEQSALNEPAVAQAKGWEQLLAGACDHYRSATNKLAGGDRDRAYVDAMMARLNTKAVMAESHNKDPLEEVLVSRLETGRGRYAVQSDSLHVGYAQAMCQARASVAQDPLQEGLLLAFGKRLDRRKGAREDLWYYRQIDQDEGETLVSLYRNPKQDHFRSRVDALLAKLTLRAALAETPSEEARIEAVTEPLEEIAVADPHPDELLMLLDVALKSWNLSTWLTLHMEEWCDQCEVALERPKLLPTQLATLRSEQTGLLAEVQDRDPEAAELLVIKTVEASATDLLFAHQMLVDRCPKIAQIGVKDAYRWLQRGLVELEVQEPMTPSVFLTQGIEEQNHTKLLTIAAVDGEKPQAALNTMLASSEIFVLDKVSDFGQLLESHLEEGKKRTTVLRLFNDGWEEAALAVPALNDGEWDVAHNYQEKAIDLWEEALALLEDEDGDEEGKTGGEGQGAGGPSETDTSSLSPTELFELLQEMDQNDQPANREGMPVRQGVRPW